MLTQEAGTEESPIFARNRKLDGQGRTSIPPEIRDAIGVRIGDRVNFKLYNNDGDVIVVFEPYNE